MFVFVPVVLHLDSGWDLKAFISSTIHLWNISNGLITLFSFSLQLIKPSKNEQKINIKVCHQHLRKSVVMLWKNATEVCKQFERFSSSRNWGVLVTVTAGQFSVLDT